MAWEYRTVYVDARGRVSVEGDETVIEKGERQSGFIRGVLNDLGREGWELASIHHLGVRQTAYYILKREGEGPGRRQLKAEYAQRFADKAAEAAEAAQEAASQ